MVVGGRVGSKLRGGGNAHLMDEVDIHCSDGVLLAFSGAFLPDMVTDAAKLAVGTAVPGIRRPFLFPCVEHEAAGPRNPLCSCLRN